MSEDETHDRLVEWGKWARCPEPGGASTSEGYLRERLDPSHDGEPTEEVAITDKAVARVRQKRKEYWRVLARYYMTDLSEYEICRETHQYTMDRVTAVLRQARTLVCYHILKLEQGEA